MSTILPYQDIETEADCIEPLLSHYTGKDLKEYVEATMPYYCKSPLAQEHPHDHFDKINTIGFILLRVADRLTYLEARNQQKEILS